MSHFVHDTELVKLLNSITNDVELLNVWFICIRESVQLEEFFPSIKCDVNYLEH